VRTPLRRFGRFFRGFAQGGSNPGDPAILYGESPGGGSAVRLAGDLCREGIEPGGLIVESSFNSLVDAGHHHFPFLPVSLILIDRFEYSGTLPA